MYLATSVKIYGSAISIIIHILEWNNNNRSNNLKTIFYKLYFYIVNWTTSDYEIEVFIYLLIHEIVAVIWKEA